MVFMSFAKKIIMHTLCNNTILFLNDNFSCLEQNLIWMSHNIHIQIKTTLLSEKKKLRSYLCRMLEKHWNNLFKRQLSKHQSLNICISGYLKPNFLHISNINLFVEKEKSRKIFVSLSNMSWISIFRKDWKTKNEHLFIDWIFIDQDF